MSVLIERARVFAYAAHAAAGQKRKYTGEDYIVHPEEVAGIVNTVPGRTDEMVAAAWLHDTVEDTEVTIEQIRHMFGEDVGTLVGWLTDISTPEDGDRATRKAKDREHSEQAPAAAQTIKIADIISNVTDLAITRSITEYDPKFERYIGEKLMLLNLLRKGNKELWERAMRWASWFYDSLPEVTEK